MDLDYGRRYRELYERHWWWRAREAGLLEAIVRLQPPQGWKRILDVGCGDGLFFDQLLRFAEVEGVEPAAELVTPTGRHRGRIHVQPFDESFQPASKYDLILMLDVLEHLDDPAAALRRALGLLNPAGLVIITVPAFMAIWTNHDAVNHHRTRYTMSSLRSVASQAQMRIIKERYWFQWLFPVKLAVRIKEQVTQSPPAPASVPSAWLNKLLYVTSRVEQKLLSPLRLPFGSSLFVIGERASESIAASPRTL